MEPVGRPFDRGSMPVHRDGDINHTKIKGSYQEMAKENFISISLKPKTPVLLNLRDYKKVHTFVKTFFKETRETFPLVGRLKYFLENWEKNYKRFNNPKHSHGLFYRLCGDSLPTKNTNKGKIKSS